MLTLPAILPLDYHTTSGQLPNGITLTLPVGLPDIPALGTIDRHTTQPLVAPCCPLPRADL